MPTPVRSNIFSVTVLKKGGQFGHNNSSNEIRSSSCADNNSSLKTGITIHLKCWLEITCLGLLIILFLSSLFGCCMPVFVCSNVKLNVYVWIIHPATFENERGSNCILFVLEITFNVCSRGKINLDQKLNNESLL